jgi:hypothetical protein
VTFNCPVDAGHSLEEDSRSELYHHLRAGHAWSPRSAARVANLQFDRESYGAVIAAVLLLVLGVVAAFSASFPPAVCSAPVTFTAAAIHQSVLESAAAGVFALVAALGFVLFWITRPERTRRETARILSGDPTRGEA